MGERKIECPICGKHHDELLEQVGETEFVIPVQACPRVPDNHIYVDHEFPTGPRGLLLRLE